MAASDYVNAYLQFWCWVNDTFTMASVRNYLQDGMGGQSTRAGQAYASLMAALPKLVGLPAGKPLPENFEVKGDKYIRTSLWRVYHGKGAPDEIQDAIYLASLCNLVGASTLGAYADNNLGIDCGGFVANYWGIGHPNSTTPSPTGATGYLPRTIWGLAASLRRKSASEIQPNDAAVFFKDVKDNNPDIPAQKVNGSFDTSSGSQAFHIGVVSSVTVVGGGNQISLEIAESSGATASSGGNGVNVRSLGTVTATVAKGLVYCMDGQNRVYFTGKQGSVSPYMPNGFGA